MPTTARSHLDNDLVRMELIFREAVGIKNRGDAQLADDLFRQAVAMGVGALDAYLCDAYTDTLTRTLKAYRSGRLSRLPAGYAKTLLPAGRLLAKHYRRRPEWALRMAARDVMEKDNLLQISRLKDLLNPGLASGHKLWLDVLPDYLQLKRRRLTKHFEAEINAATGKDREKLEKQAVSAIMLRIGKVIKRRHDIVHNCDRPKTAIQAMPERAARGMLNDLTDFAHVLDAHLDAHHVY